MLDLTIRPEAERDIKDIWRYTRKRWSRPQADHYVAILRANISELAHRPGRGRACNEISLGMDFAAHLANDDV